MFNLKRYYYICVRSQREDKSFTFLRGAVYSEGYPTLDSIVEAFHKEDPQGVHLEVISISRISKAEYKSLSQPQTKFV